MKTNKSHRQAAAPVLCGATIAALLLAAGCGGGGGGTTTSIGKVAASSTATSGGLLSSGDSFYNSGVTTYHTSDGVTTIVGASPDTPVANPLTRDTEFTVSNDAKGLAVREAVSAFVSLDAARAFEADLAAIRAAYPVAQNFHTSLGFDPHIIKVSVDKSAPWLAKWEAASPSINAASDTPVDLTTGEPALDALLKKYDITRIAGGGFVDNPRTVYLYAGASLNTRLAASQFVGSSAYLSDAGTALGSGIATNISARNRSDETTRVYDFIDYGLDPRMPITPNFSPLTIYLHTYTIHADGTITEQITEQSNGTTLTNQQ